MSPKDKWRCGETHSVWYNPDDETYYITFDGSKPTGMNVAVMLRKIGLREYRAFGLNPRKDKTYGSLLEPLHIFNSITIKEEKVEA